MGVPVGVAREPDDRARRAAATTSSTASSPGCRASRTSRSAHARTISVASFFSPERLGYPPGKAQRERLLGRIDALVATSPEVADAAAERFPGDYRDRLARRRHGALPPGPEAAADRARVARPRAPARPQRDPDARRAARLGARRCCARGRSPGGRTSRAGSPAASTSRLGRDAGRARAASSPRPRSSSRRSRAARGSRSRPTPPAPRSPRRPASRSSPSSPPPRSPGSPRTPTLRTREQREARRRRRGAELRRRRRRARRASTAASPAAGATPAATATRSRTARGSSATCTCTPSWSHDCSIPVADLLDHAEAIGLGAIAVTDHNRFGGAPEAVELARGRKLTVIPGEEVKTDGQGEVIGLFLEEEIPRGLSFADTIAAIRAQGGLVYLPHPFDRMHAIPDPRDAAPPPRRHRRVRGLQRAPAVRVLQRRGAPLRAQVRPDDGRRLRRARAPGSRHRRACGCARSTARRSSWSACTGAEILRRPKSLLVPPGPEVGRPRPRKGSARGEHESVPPVTAVPADEIYEKYLQKAISEINELGDEIARAAGGAAVPVLGSGHPLADVFLLKHRPQASEAQEGVAFYGRAGQAILKSLQRLRVDPMAVYGTNCVKFAERRRRRRGARLADPRAAHRPAEARRRDGRGRARVPERPRVPARAAGRGEARRAPAVHADGARRSSSPTSTPRSTSSPRRPRSGTPSRCSAPGGRSCRRTRVASRRSRSSRSRPA